jgi:hypothetical protein
MSNRSKKRIRTKGMPMDRNEIVKEMDRIGIPKFNAVSKVMKSLGGIGDIGYAIRLNIYAAEKYGYDIARQEMADELEQWDMKVRTISARKLSELLVSSFRRIIDKECTKRGYDRNVHWLQIYIPLELFFKGKFNLVKFRKQFRQDFKDAEIAESLDDKLVVTWGIGEFGSTVIKGNFEIPMHDFGKNYLKIVQ